MILTFFTERATTNFIKDYLGSILDVLKTRCPSCDKLYAVDTDDIIVDRPEFECSRCNVHFAFDATSFIEFDTDDAVNSREVESYLLQWQQMPEMLEAKSIGSDVIASDMPEITEDIDLEMLNKENSKNTIVEEINVENTELATEFHAPCPKCNYNNNLAAKECRGCGVLLAKVQDGRAESYRSTVVVRARWEKVLENYEETARHDQFLQICKDENCLPFASAKYHAILSADPSEEIAQKMKEKVVVLMQAEMIQRAKNAGIHIEWMSSYSRMDRLWMMCLGFSFVLACFYAITIDPYRALGVFACMAGLIWFFRSQLTKE